QADDCKGGWVSAPVRIDCVGQVVSAVNEIALAADDPDPVVSGIPRLFAVQKGFAKTVDDVFRSGSAKFDVAIHLSVVIHDAVCGGMSRAEVAIDGVLVRRGGGAAGQRLGA